MRSAPLATLILFAVTGSVLQGQHCAGRSDFKPGRFKVGADFSNYAEADDGTPGGKQYGASFAQGHTKGLFSSFGLSRIEYDEDPAAPSGLSNTATVFTAGVGAPLAQSADHATGICVVGGVDYQSGPSGTASFFGSTFDINASAWRTSVGASAGTRVELSDKVALIPFVDLRYSEIRARVTIDDGTTTDTQRQTITLGLIELGGGFVVNKSITIRPSFLRDFGLGADASPQNVYVLGVAWSFGRTIP